MPFGTRAQKKLLRKIKKDTLSMKDYKSENAKKNILDHVVDTAYYVLPPSPKRGTGYGARIWGTVCWVFNWNKQGRNSQRVCNNELNTEILSKHVLLSCAFDNKTNGGGLFL